MLRICAQVIRFCLAFWVGGTLVVVLSAPVVFRRIASRDTAGEVFGEILRRFEAVKHVLSLLLVIAVFLQLERTGGFAGQSVVAGIAIFVAIASNVYLAMVVRPRLNYFRMKVGSFDAAAPEDPWRKRFDRLHRRSTQVLVIGWIAAAVALGFGP
jgi:preprotein translocase subunit SecG